MTSRSLFVFASAALLTTLGGSAQAADIKQQCAAAYEGAQGARRDGKLKVAREQALQCSQDACPAVVKKDCAQWLSEVEGSIPTVVFEARDAAGADTTEVRVFFDGEILKERLDGKAVGVDPGEHTFRYEVTGASPIEERVTLREGEKNRKLSVNFSTGATGQAAGAAGGGGGADAGHGGPPVAAFVLGGIGIVGIGLFATFGLLGRGQKSDLEDSCSPNCSEDDVDSVRTKLIIADISLVGGVVALGVATYLFISAPSSKPAASAPSARLSPVRFDVQPTRGGGFAQVVGRF